MRECVGTRFKRESKSYSRRRGRVVFELRSEAEQSRGTNGSISHTGEVLWTFPESTGGRFKDRCPVDPSSIQGWTLAEPLSHGFFEHPQTELSKIPPENQLSRPQRNIRDRPTAGFLEVVSNAKSVQHRPNPLGGIRDEAETELDVEEWLRTFFQVQRIGGPSTGRIHA